MLYELLLIDDRGREIKNYTPLKEEVPIHLLHVSVSNAVSKIKKNNTHTHGNSLTSSERLFKKVI